MKRAIHPRLASRRLLALAAATLFVPTAGAQFMTTQKAPSRGSLEPSSHNSPPAISASLEHDARALEGDLLRFEVTVTDPDGDAVTLKLLNPPPGLVFEPLSKAPSGSASTVRWWIPLESCGLQRLIFEAHDSVQRSERTRLEVPIQVGGFGINAGFEFGDVTGDGVLDLVAKASRADIGGVNDTGAVYVWSGQSTMSGPPSATLSVPGGVAWTGLASNLLQLADVTGDGVLDVVAGAPGAEVNGVSGAGAVYVWAGGEGLSGNPAPTAALSAPGAGVNDFLGSTAGVGVLLSDLTGDGVRDVIAGTSNADVGGTADTGALYLWEGGAGLAGAPAPRATLSVPGAAAGDVLGQLYPQGVLFADVSGDGIFDLISGSPNVDLGGVQDVGALYVWNGGASLTGQAAPSASLTVPGAVASDKLGTSNGGVQLGDVSGDGVADVLSGTPRANVAGFFDAGAAYVWNGGAGMSGGRSPSSTLLAPDMDHYDEFSEASPGIQLVDLTGDGVRDVLVGARNKDLNEQEDVGGIYLWAGGAGLAGTPAVHARLEVPGAMAYDQLGMALAGAGIRTFEVTGDGAPDVIAVAPATRESVLGAGTVYVWSGAGLAGTVAPTATLTRPGPKKWDYLGWVNYGQALQFADVTGDGQDDLLVGAVREDQGFLQDVGAIHVWAGGPGLSGSPPATASLKVPAPNGYDQLGSLGTSGHGVLLADVTGDGTTDVVAGAAYATVAGAASAGAAFVWAGGASMSGAPAPLATLENPAPVGFTYMGEASGQGLQLLDLGGGKELDILIGTEFAELGGQAGAGAIYTWQGGAGLAGTPAGAGLTVPGAAQFDALGTLIRAVDLTGNGQLEVFGGAAYADLGGVSDTGAIYRWSGALLTSSGPQGTLSVSGATSGDRLGE